MFASKFANVIRMAPRSSVRQMSGHMGTPAEMRADVVRWKNITIGMTILTAATCVYIYVFPEEHIDQRTDLPYLKCKTKPFPWRECPDCGLMEMPCWIECRKAHKEKEDAEKGNATSSKAH